MKGLVEVFHLIIVNNSEKRINATPKALECQSCDNKNCLLSIKTDTTPQCVVVHHQGHLVQTLLKIFLFKVVMKTAVYC